MELFRQTNIDWLGRKWLFLGFSLIFSVAGVLSMLFWHHIPLGVDFRGGTQITVHFNSAPNEDHIRAAMDGAGVHDARIQRISQAGGGESNDVIVSLPQSTAQDRAHDQGRAEVENALQANYRDSGFQVQQVDIVGPTAGKQLQHQAFLATIYSLVGTIVVFDRIRENLAMNRRETLKDVVNRSINQTLSRTVLTSGLTFLTVLSLYVFGGEVLHGFSFALVIGILIGTYSSIAVAAPMLVAYQDWRASKGKRAVLPAAKVVRR